MILKLVLLYLASIFIHCDNDSSIGVQPAAKCSTGFFYKTLPLIADQAYITNLDHLFNGYNLQFKLQDIDDFSKYITKGEKLLQQGKQIPDVPLIGLKNYHIDKRGNAWGPTFIALTERSQRTYVHYGVINSNTSAPVVNNFISVENNTNTTCFDAVLFKSQDLILVDCVIKLPSPNSKGQILQNIFYYHKISDGSFIKNIKTQMYINFRSITRRSMILYSDLFNQHTFLLRAYYYNEIQKPLNQNTYIEIFMITEPNDPWIVQIIDRAFLKAKTLSVSDVRVYLGEIFILDNKMGVYRVYISDEEDLKFEGYYQVKGFQKFSVYSNNYDDHFQLALANSHSVLEIDWTNRNEPRLINKYSLMPDSKVSQIFLNERFLFVQSQSQSDKFTYNYTWIMNRGDRTYTKAFKVIKHNSAKTIIDVNEDMSYLIIIDDQKMVNYRLDDSNMVIKIKDDPDLINKISTFKIIATSQDQMDNSTIQKCNILVNFTLLDTDNKTMWPIGDAPPSKFTANYPGKVKIKLHQYVLGPNITYRIRETDHDVIKKLKVYQQEQLTIKWQETPPFLDKKIKFLLTETTNYKELSHDLMHIYLQDDENFTYFIICQPEHTLQQINCRYTHQQLFEGSINFWVSGFFINRKTLKQNHVIAYTTKSHVNKVSLIDFTEKQNLQDINLEKGFAGNATSVAITNKQLYVVLKYIKKIQIYDLQQCLDRQYGDCVPKCNLNHLSMYNLGVKYFSPTQVHTSIFHNNIIFIKTSDRIIVIDYNSQCKPKLLGVMIPVEMAQIQFTFKVNQKFLILTIDSLNVIKQYNIQRITLGQIRLTKQYPKYGYSIPRSYDLDISDRGNCIYVTMTNQQGDHQVFVYRSGFPAVGTLYDVVDLVSFENILVDTTGFEIDYVTVIANKQLKVFRQYEQPQAQIFNPNISYSFYLDYSNPSSRSNLQLIDVKIINLPTFITVNPELNDIMKTKNYLYSDHNKVNEVNDTKWWEGNVVSVEADCQSCRGQDPIIKVNNHIQHQEMARLVPVMSEYQWSQRGGSIQAMSSIINMRGNGSIQQIVKLPIRQHQLCITLTVGFRAEFQVSGCLMDGVVNLFLTAFVSDKGFPFEQFQTTAIDLFKLDAVNDLVILVDTQSDSYKKTRGGGVYLYAINSDDQIPTPFVQVEYIDGDDLGMDQLGEIFINNAELTYHVETNTYRLYITEMTKGVFVIDFKYSSSNNAITVRSINYLKIQPLLTALGYQMPYDATYQALAKISASYDQTLKKSTDKMLLTTGKFHTIELTIDYSLEGNLQQIKITRLYTRYAFYNIQNYIKYHNGLFVISQILPDQFDIENRSKQLLTTYSTNQNRSFSLDTDQQQSLNLLRYFNFKTESSPSQTKVEQRGFLGGFRIDDTVLHNYDFNLTRSDDGHSEPRVGMVLIQNFSNKLQKFTLHQNLSVLTKQMVSTQIIYIDLKNDFSLQKIRILINGYSPYPEWKLITIILFSIIGGILLIIGIFIGVRKLLQKYGKTGQGQQNQNRQTMITQSDRSDRKSFEPQSLRNSQQIDSGQSKKDKKKRQKQEQKQRKRIQKQQKQMEKQRQNERKRQEKQRQKADKQQQKASKERARYEKQVQKSSQKDRYKETQKQKQRQREAEKQRQKQKQKERQRQKQISRQSQDSFNSSSRYENRNNQNEYSRSRGNEEDQFFARSRFAQRRNQRQRPSRNQGNSERQPPPARTRRNVAIIQQ